MIIIGCQWSHIHILLYFIGPYFVIPENNLYFVLALGYNTAHNIGITKIVRIKQKN